MSSSFVGSEEAGLCGKWVGDDYSAPQVDRLWLRVYHYHKIPIYHIFYLLKGDYYAKIYPHHHMVVSISFCIIPIYPKPLNPKPLNPKKNYILST